MLIASLLPKLAFTHVLAFRNTVMSAFCIRCFSFLVQSTIIWLVFEPQVVFPRATLLWPIERTATVGTVLMIGAALSGSSSFFIVHVVAIDTVLS